MGFTKKSLLALVLALVMVLGMALPALADLPEVDPGRSKVSIEFTETGAATTVGTAEASPYVLYAGDDAAEFDLYQTPVTASVLLNDAYLTEEAQIVFDTIDPAITASVEDGVLSVTPIVGKEDVIKLTMRIDHAADKTWSNAVWTTNDYYWEGDLYIKVLPTAKFTAGSITLDRGVQGNSGTTVTASAFSSTTPGAIVIKTVGVPTPAALSNAVEVIAYGTPGSANYSFELKVKNSVSAAVEGTIPVTVDVGYMTARIINIPVRVGNSANEAGYQIATSTDKITVKRNAPTSALQFDAYPADAAGAKVADSTLTLAKAAAGTGAFGVDNIVFADIETVPGATTGLTVVPSFANGKVSLAIGANVISAKGVLHLYGKGQTSGGTAVMLVSKDVEFEIQPLTFASDVASKLTFDLNRKTNMAIDTLYVAFKTTEPNCTIKSATTKFNEAPILAGDLVATMTCTVESGYTDKYKVVSTAVAKGTGKLKAYTQLTSTDSTTTAAGDFPAKLIEVPFEIVDNTPVPTFTPDMTAVNFDLVKTTELTKEVTFTVGNQLGTGVVTAPTVSYNGAVVGGPIVTDLTYSWTNNNKTLSIASATTVPMGTYKIKVGAKVDGEDATPVEISIVVDKKLADAAHHVAANATKIEAFQNSTAQTITLDLQDYANKVLGTAEVAALVLSFVTKDDGTNDADPDIATIQRFGTTNQYEVRFGKKAGTGFLKVVGTTTTPTGTAPALYIPITVNKQKLTVNPTSLSFDLANPATSKGTLTISGNGALVVTAPIATGLTFTKNADKSTANSFVYDVEATAKAKGSFTITGATIDGFDADDVKIAYEVKDSTAIVAKDNAGAAVEKLALSMADGGEKDKLVNFTANPAGKEVTIDSVTSSDNSKMKVEKKTATTGQGNTVQYLFTALADGTGVITVTGKVNGVAAPDLIIPFTVGATEAVTLKVTPNPIALDLKGTKEVTLSVGGSVAGATVTDAKITYSGDLLTVSGLKVTAVKAGTGNVTVEAKLNGVDATLTVPFTVTDGVVTGDFLVNDVAGTTGSLFVRNSVANNQYKLTLNGYTGSVTWKSSNKAILKFIDAPAGKASSTKTGTEVQWVQVLKAGTVKVTATPATGTAKSISFTIKAEAETGFTVGDQALLVGQRASAKPEIVPATAKTKGFKFKSSDKKVVTVSSKGILVAKKAGTATITVTPKKKGLAKQTFTVTVTVDYKNLNYNSVVLLQNSDGKPNADADNVKKIFESAKFDASGNAAGANILAATATKADVKAAIATMALASKNTSDISNFYFAGAATKTGLTFTDGEYSYTDLANDLAKCTGNVVVFLDCTGGNRLINAKAASDADIFAAFSKAVKPGLSTMTNSAVEKLSFTVFTSTAKAKTTVTPTVSADGSSVQYKFTKLFAETLKVSDSNTISVGTNGIVNVKQLWAKLKAAKGSVWASKKSVMPIYGYVPAAPVTP